MEPLTIQELRESLEHKTNTLRETIAEEVEAKYRPVLYEKDREILSLRMQNESLRRETEILWQSSCDELTKERTKVRQLEDRLKLFYEEHSTK